MMPKIAEGNANKVWIVPSEIGKALEGLGSTMNTSRGSPTRSRARARGSTWARPSRAVAEDAALTDTQRGGGRRRRRRRGGERPGDPQPPPGHDRHRTGRRPADPGAPPPSDAPSNDVAILLAGVAAGTINTVVGSGTLITFPTLLAFGVPPVTANVSNTVGLVPGSLSGAIGYRRELAGQRPRCCGSARPPLLGGLIGALLLLVLPPVAFDAIVPALILLGWCW